MKTAFGYVKTIEFWGNVPSKEVVFLVGGKAGVGKTTSANMLKDLLSDKGYENVKMIAFSDPIKDCAIDYFNWNAIKDDTGRKLLQDIGKTGRSYDENLWVKNIYNNLEENLFSWDFVIVDDWRLPQEADYLKDKLALGVITIYVDAPNRETLRGKPEYHDITETSLENDYVYDYLIDNTGTFDELESQLKGILDNILGV